MYCCQLLQCKAIRAEVLMLYAPGSVFLDFMFTNAMYTGHTISIASKCGGGMSHYPGEQGQQRVIIQLHSKALGHHPEILNANLQHTYIFVCNASGPQCTPVQEFTSFCNLCKPVECITCTATWQACWSTATLKMQAQHITLNIKL
jgi:hypothetical protein